LLKIVGPGQFEGIVGLEVNKVTLQALSFVEGEELPDL
jgi:hypothetical protein